MIQGIITDKKVDQKKYPIVLETYGQLGFLYQSYVESNPKLYLKTLPSFKECFDYVLSASMPLLVLNKKQDICLSLLYNPYFNEFYDAIKSNEYKIRRWRKRFLIKWFLSDLADLNGFMAKYNCTPKYVLKNDIINRSRELIEILKR